MHKKSWVLIILVLIAIWIASAILANVATLFQTTPSVQKGNVAMIPVKGPITGDGIPGTFSVKGAASTEIVKLLEKARKDDSVKAVILEINSPGGSAVASQEISDAVKDLNKTTVAWIREVGASGAYWVASSTDHVIASEFSSTGSIGVIASYLEYAKLLQDWNITYRRLVGGEYKDTGSPFKELSDEEKEILQDKIDLLHEHFIKIVADNRNLSYSEVEGYANGLTYFGIEAIDMGLIDEIGGKKEAIKYIEKSHNITVKTKQYETAKSLAQVLGGLFSSHGYSLGQSLKEEPSSSESLIAVT